MWKLSMRRLADWDGVFDLAVAQKSVPKWHIKDLNMCNPSREGCIAECLFVLDAPGKQGIQLPRLAAAFVSMGVVVGPLGTEEK